MATVRGIQGVNPSYFASMPTVALDPNAGKPDPQYARLLSDAMQNNAAQTDRRREKDEDNAFKATDQRQQAYRDIRANEINKRNAAVNEAGEARLKSGADFNHDRLQSTDTERLIEALEKAKFNHDKMAEEYFLSELQKRGLKPIADEPTPAAPAAAPPAASPPPPGPKPVDRTPIGPPPGPPPPTARFPDAAEASAAPPMKGAPAGVAPRATASFPPVGAGAAPPPGPAPGPPPGPGPAQAPPSPARPQPSPSDGIPFINKTQDMSWIEGKQPPLSMPPRPMASDNAQFYNDMDWHPPTEKELLDRAIADVVAREKAGLSPTAKPLLPGKTLRRRAAESDQLLSNDDPLGKAP